MVGVTAGTEISGDKRVPPGERVAPTDCIAVFTESGEKAICDGAEEDADIGAAAGEVDVEASSGNVAECAVCRKV